MGRQIGHGEHDMERNAELLCGMSAGKTRRIGNDAVGNKVSRCRARASLITMRLIQVMVNSVPGFVI